MTSEVVGAYQTITLNIVPIDKDTTITINKLSLFARGRAEAFELETITNGEFN
jgi:hypothetical protein